MNPSLHPRILGLLLLLNLGSIQFLEMSLPFQYYFKIHPFFLSYFYDFLFYVYIFNQSRVCFAIRCHI